MASHIDESRLLDLIEGDLDSASAAALRRQLADDPQTLVRLAKLEGDRHELRSLPEPSIPPDLRAQLETLLARPMLIEAERPGAYRRQQRRLLRQKRLKRFAVAASIAMVSALGVWMTVTLVAPELVGAVRKSLQASRADSNDSAADHSLASNGRFNKPAQPVATVSAAELAAITKSDDVVHHYLPQPVPMEQFVFDQPGAARRDESKSATIFVAGKTLAAPFEIVVQTRDVTAVEQVMVAVVRETSPNTGLMRNFSYDEARKIEEEWRIASTGSRTEAPAIAADASRKPGLAGESPTALLAKRVRERMSQRESTGSAEIKSSGLIIGLSQNAPSLEQQLEFSSRGASFTVMVPAAELRSLLERLGQTPGQSTWLRMIQGKPGSSASQESTPTAPTINEWMQQMPMVRTAADQLGRENAESMILVPVLIVPQK